MYKPAHCLIALEESCELYRTISVSPSIPQLSWGYPKILGVEVSHLRRGWGGGLVLGLWVARLPKLNYSL